MTKQTEELERAKAIQAKYVLAMPIEVSRLLVASVAILADKVGRQERLLRALATQPASPYCGCSACLGLWAEIRKEVGICDSPN